MAWITYNPDGSVKEEGRDATYSVHGPTGTKIRDYTAEERAAADAAQAAWQVATNDATLRGGLQAVIDAAIARQATMQTVLDATNATINSAPAPYLKDIARATKRQDRAITRLARIVGRLTTTTDTGTD